MLPEWLLRSIPSPSDGPSTCRLQIEVRIFWGLWHFSRFELPGRLRSFVTSSFKVHLRVDLWWSMGTLRVTGGRVMRKRSYIRTSRRREMDCVTTSQLSQQHASPAIATLSDSPLRSPLWLHVGSVVSNKEEILVPFWPAHRGHREIYGVCLFRRGCFWTELDINNPSPVYHSSIGSSFIPWSSDFIEYKRWAHAGDFHMLKLKTKSHKVFFAFLKMLHIFCGGHCTVGCFSTGAFLYKRWWFPLNFTLSLWKPLRIWHFMLFSHKLKQWVPSWKFFSWFHRSAIGQVS